MYNFKVNSILIAGPIGSGKSSVAKILHNLYAFEVYSFARALRDEVNQCLIEGNYPQSLIDRAAGGDREMQRLLTCLTKARITPTEVTMETEDGEKVKVTVPHLDVYAKPTSELAREILQLWGTPFRRATNDDYWVQKLQPAYCANPGELRCIDDVRFDNELALKGDKGKSVYVMSDKAERQRTAGYGESFNSFSADYVLPNNGDLKDLQKEVIKMIHIFHEDALDNVLDRVLDLS